MKSIKLTAGLLLGALLLGAQGGAQAAVTFESIASMSAVVSTPLTSDGFVFTSKNGMHAIAGIAGYGASNGTNNLVYLANSGTDSESFSATGNALFNLDSIDLGGWLGFPTESQSIALTGYKSNGDVVIASFVVSNVFATYRPLNFNSVVRVALGGLSNPAYVAVDNIVTSPVPELESFAMLLAGLGLLGFVQARRRKLRL